MRKSLKVTNANPPLSLSHTKNRKSTYTRANVAPSHPLCPVSLRGKKARPSPHPPRFAASTREAVSVFF
ncbi:hypothetical protein LX32DRAFT_645898 [Colletotrichum zoysiae]|uniref:Uncharacterized protein n=1 Tax=Colletotrichum zoysiae TaxID=1216348 RepID=A0AAD9H555_9PEZI|nr:hypothetical protein LX32DRAFT_645898 [Colletotrichum zoysiae]